MNELLRRMVTNDQSRTELMADPKTALEKAGYDLTSRGRRRLAPPIATGQIIYAIRA